MEEKDNELRVDAEILASIIRPITMLLDVMIRDHFGRENELSRAKEMLHKMRDHNGLLSALPFPGTLNKADKQHHEIEVFAALINLVEKRLEQKKAAMSLPPFLDDKMVSRLMGIDL